jgi:hypothetical protein
VCWEVGTVACGGAISRSTGRSLDILMDPAGMAAAETFLGEIVHYYVLHQEI